MKKIILVVLLLLLNNVSYSQSLGWTLSDVKNYLDSTEVQYRVEVSEYGQHLLVTQIIDDYYSIYIFSPNDTLDLSNWKVMVVVLNYTTKKEFRKGIKDIKVNWNPTKLNVPKNSDHKKEWIVNTNQKYVFIKSIKLDRESKKIGIKGQLTFSYTH